jgi:hypothetical protein
MRPETRKYRECRYPNGWDKASIIDDLFIALLYHHDALTKRSKNWEGYLKTSGLMIRCRRRNKRYFNRVTQYKTYCSYRTTGYIGKL